MKKLILLAAAGLICAAPIASMAKESAPITADQVRVETRYTADKIPTNTEIYQHVAKRLKADGVSLTQARKLPVGYKTGDGTILQAGQSYWSTSKAKLTVKANPVAYCALHNQGFKPCDQVMAEMDRAYTKSVSEYLANLADYKARLDNAETIRNWMIGFVVLFIAISLLLGLMLSRKSENENRRLRNQQDIDSLPPEPEGGEWTVLRETGQTTDTPTDQAKLRPVFDATPSQDEHEAPAQPTSARPNPRPFFGKDAAGQTETAANGGEDSARPVASAK